MRSTPFSLCLLFAICVPVFAFGQKAPSQPLKAKQPVTALVDHPDTIPTAEFDYDKQVSVPLTPLHQVKPAKAVPSTPRWVFSQYPMLTKASPLTASTAKSLKRITPR
ncbi:MAG: hypothetical protein AAFR61_31175 [Bacteroidota bacterium]